MTVRSLARLPRKLISQLGKVTDQSLAEKFGIPVHKIRVERRRQGIQSVVTIAWTPAQIAVLGTMSDQQAAKTIGVTRNAAFSKRVSFGIPAHGKSRTQAAYPWKSSDIKKLGKLSDNKLATQLGISDSVVTSKRNSRGIGASQPFLGEGRRPWTGKELAMLGKKPDTVVVKLTGRGRRHVRAKRECLGIPPFQSQSQIQFTKKTFAGMSKMTNLEIAERLGVTIATVALHRRRLFGERRRHKK